MGTTDDRDGNFAEDFGLMTRRRLIAGAGALALVPGVARAQTCAAPAPEMAGPFPADGSNRIGQTRVNVLTEAGVIRDDIRPSFAGLSGTAEGVPTVLDLTLTDAGCAPLAGAAVYVWHCDAAGLYSLYEIPDRNYLRGMGVTDAEGRLRFTTVFPGCYRGRWPHIHFEVFRSPDAAVSGQGAVLTSQLAIDGAVSEAVYAAVPAYAPSIPALAALSLDRDMIFRDNSAAEMAAMTPAVSGSLAEGFRLTSAFAVPV